MRKMAEALSRPRAYLRPEDYYYMIMTDRELREKLAMLETLCHDLLGDVLGSDKDYEMLRFCVAMLLKTMLSKEGIVNSELYRDLVEKLARVTRGSTRA